MSLRHSSGTGFKQWLTPGMKIDFLSYKWWESKQCPHYPLLSSLSGQGSFWFFRSLFSLSAQSSWVSCMGSFVQCRHWFWWTRRTARDAQTRDDQKSMDKYNKYNKFYFSAGTYRSICKSRITCIYSICSLHIQVLFYDIKVHKMEKEHTPSFTFISIQISVLI